MKAKKGFDKKITSESKPEPFQGLATRSNSERVLQLSKSNDPLVDMECLRIGLCTPRTVQSCPTIHLPMQTGWARRLNRATVRAESQLLATIVAKARR